MADIPTILSPRTARTRTAVRYRGLTTRKTCRKTAGRMRPRVVRKLRPPCGYPPTVRQAHVRSLAERRTAPGCGAGGTGHSVGVRRAGAYKIRPGVAESKTNARGSSIPEKARLPREPGLHIIWRRRRDSNPRTRGYRINGFRDRRIQPLCHPSAWGESARLKDAPRENNWRRVRDLNPGDAFDAYTISNRAPSATRTTLRY